MRPKSIFLNLTLAALLSPAASAVPVVAANVISTIPSDLFDSNTMRGWYFTTTSTTSVSALGWFDEGGDGLFQDHEVGLWTSSGTLLASTTVLAGNSGILMGGFRFQSIAPLLIGAGNYVIAGLSSNVNLVNPLEIDLVAAGLDSSRVTFAPDIIYGQNRVDGNFSHTFAFPLDQNLPTSDYEMGTFGANLLVETNVPELDSSRGVLPFFTVALLGLTNRRRRQAQA